MKRLWGEVRQGEPLYHPLFTTLHGEESISLDQICESESSYRSQDVHYISSIGVEEPLLGLRGGTLTEGPFT